MPNGATAPPVGSGYRPGSSARGRRRTAPPGRSRVDQALSRRPVDRKARKYDLGEPSKGGLRRAGRTWPARLSRADTLPLVRGDGVQRPQAWGRPPGPPVGPQRRRTGSTEDEHDRDEHAPVSDERTLIALAQGEQEKDATNVAKQMHVLLPIPPVASDAVHCQCHGRVPD